VYAFARLGGFDVIHIHDPALLNGLWHARRVLGGRFAIVFTNGGPLTPEHLTRPDVVHSLTQVDVDRLRASGFAAERVVLVPYGIKPLADTSRSFQSDRPLKIVGVGALNDSHKGFTTAIRGAARLPGAELRLLGQRDGETPALESLGRELLGTRFSLDTVTRVEVSAALSAADVFVLPTHYEGFCIAALEALAAGIPTVLSDIPVLRWLVDDAAVLVPPDRPEDWAEALAGLTVERRRDLSERGRRRAAQFHWPRLAGRYDALYERALAVRSTLQGGLSSVS
jgi:glycosyltransferase involved in cell wall biosynthesis